MPKDYALALTVSHSERLPTAEELYANGPHLATFEFQIGDPNLISETGLTYDLSFRRTAGAVTGSLSLFRTDYRDFIFLSPSGTCALTDGTPVPCTDPAAVPVFNYIQTDADFHGAEAHLDIDLYHQDPRHLTLEIGGDTVQAEEHVSNDPLPRITPDRYSLGVHYRGPRLWGLVEGRRTRDQTRIAPLETPTDGYTFLNLTVGWRLLAGGLVHDFILRGTNLTDELARNHISPLKDIVPLPGRDVGLSYRLTF
jgi:iron complex outermembrane receptor protein